MGKDKRKKQQKRKHSPEAEESNVIKTRKGLKMETRTRGASAFSAYREARKAEDAKKEEAAKKAFKEKTKDIGQSKVDDGDRKDVQEKISTEDNQSPHRRGKGHKGKVDVTPTSQKLGAEEKSEVSRSPRRKNKRSSSGAWNIKEVSQSESKGGDVRRDDQVNIVTENSSDICRGINAKAASPLIVSMVENNSNSAAKRKKQDRIPSQINDCSPNQIDVQPPKRHRSGDSKCTVEKVNFEGEGEMVKNNGTTENRSTRRKGNNLNKETKIAAENSGNKNPLKERVFYLSPEYSAVIIEKNEDLCISGKVNINCLYGEVTILGHSLKRGQFYPLYSPDTNGLIMLKIHKPSGKLDSNVLNNDLKRFTDNHKTIKKILGKAKGEGVVIVLQRLENKMSNLLTSVSPFQNMFMAPPSVGASNMELVENVKARLATQGKFNCVRVSQEQQETVDLLTELAAGGASPVIVMSGGQNVGKSTLARYLLNSLLNCCDSVGFLECDLGQTEFTPPACVSLHLVKDPVLGPPFEHIRKAEISCFVGVVSPGGDPAHYIRCVEYVWQKYQAMDKKPPLIINTMGWNKGLGLSIMADVLRLVQPDLVIQIISEKRVQNFPPLTPQFVTDTPGCHDLQFAERVNYENVKTHQVITLKSRAAVNHESRYSPANHRSLALLAYLSQMLSADLRTGADLHAVQPYKVSWSSVGIHVGHAQVPYSQLLYALNSSIVALCAAPEEKMFTPEDEELPKYFKEMPVCKCVGYGIVRAIDPVQKVFYLMTPVPTSDLGQVNCLLRGAVELPSPFLMKQPKIDGHIPYIGESKDVTGATSIKPRRHLQRR